MAPNSITPSTPRLVTPDFSVTMAPKVAGKRPAPERTRTARNAIRLSMNVLPIFSECPGAPYNSAAMRRLRTVLVVLGLAMSATGGSSALAAGPSIVALRAAGARQIQDLYIREPQ